MLERIKKYIITTPTNISGNSNAPINNIMGSPEEISTKNALNGYRYIETARELIDRYYIEPSRVESYLSSIVPTGSLLEVCDYVGNLDCDPKWSYRRLDNSCNNLKSPYLGRSSTPFDRFLPAMFVDGLSDPRTHSFFGIILPGPRELSSAIYQSDGYASEDQNLTNIATVFGNFLNHDLQNVETLNMRDCCEIQREFQIYSMSVSLYSREAYEALLSMSRAINAVCMAIPISAQDQYFSFYNRRCMQYTRSTSTPGLNCKLNTRQQRNMNTHFLDASQIYGSNILTLGALRTGINGTMSTFPNSGSGELLPQAFLKSVRCNVPQPNTNNASCFTSGDKRVNDQPPLTAMYTLFVREHNRIAKTLALVDKNWNDEKIFQEARKMVIAELQHIVYNEYLPIILGDGVMRYYELALKPTGYSNQYSEMVNPAIRSAFASVMDMTLATMTRGTFNANGRSHKLSSSYLNPGIFYENTNSMTSIVEEMVKQNPQKFDRLVSDELTNRYQELVPGEGLDLIAKIIQGGRDHGLPVYLAWLLFCGFQTPIDFNDLPFHDNTAKQLLSSMYVSVYDLDLVTAGVMETPLPGTKIGPTFACIMGAQFQRLKRGDRFWYENNGVGNFSEGQLDAIRKVSLAKIICENTNLTTIQRNVFLPESVTNPRVNCKDLKNFDSCSWMATSSWGEYSLWTQCIGGVRVRFRNCLLDTDAPCTCVGSPIDLERCPSEMGVSNLLSGEKFKRVETFLLQAASVRNKSVKEKPSVLELNAILKYAVSL